MAISVGRAVAHAASRTRYVLFSTFEVGKWLALAFCAFLSQCDSGAIGSNFSNVPSNWIPRPPGPALPPTTAPAATIPASMPATGTASQPANQAFNLAQAWANWISANIGTAILIIALGVLAMFLLTALCSWISSRGRFMFIDGIVQNRGAVIEPWRACSHLGNSLFGWSLALNFLGLAVTALIIGIGAGIAWPDLRSRHFSGLSITAIIVTVTLMIANGLAFMLVRMLLHDFVVPAMYLHNLRVRPAWHLVKREIITGYVGEVVLFYLMGILLTIATAAIGTVLTCATCCITAIPYVGTVVLLPLMVFMRCYGLCFIEQFGPRWTVFFDARQRCQRCGYDLRYSPQSPVCPECGTTRLNYTAPSGIYPPTSPPTVPPTM